MKWNGGVRSGSQAHLENVAQQKTKESPDGDPFFPTAIKSTDEEGKMQNILSTTTVELVLLHATADWRLKVQCNWTWRSPMFLPPLIHARQKQLPIAELVTFRSKRKAAPS